MRLQVLLRPNAPLSLTRCDVGFSGRDCSLSLQDARARVQMQEMIVDHLDRMIAPSVCRFVTDLLDRWLVELLQRCCVHSSRVGYVYVVAYNRGTFFRPCAPRCKAPRFSLRCLLRLPLKR